MSRHNFEDCALAKEMNPLDDYNWYFVHIPKNAGTAFRRVYCTQRHSSHKPCDEVSEEEAQRTVCIVRNPYDRLVSCYRYMRMSKNMYHDNTDPDSKTRHPCHGIAKRSTFDQFVRLLVSKRLPYSEHLLPQTDYLRSKSNFMYTRALRLERLDEDMTAFFGPGAKPIQRLNASRKSTDNWRTYYTPELMALVHRYYDVDFRHLPYLSSGEVDPSYAVFPYNVTTTGVEMPPRHSFCRAGTKAVKRPVRVRRRGVAKY